MSDPALSSDQIFGAPHPRETPRLWGQAAAEKALLDALWSERMPHAWLLAGPEGTGKATFAYLAARAIFSGTADTLRHDPMIPAHKRVADGNETALRALIRTPNEKTGKMRTQIAVDDVRALKRSLTLATTEGGWRVVIVDPAEDMNPSAANALLKVLEEPPEKVVFFLVTHAPRRLLPTILSRCRRLDFSPLGDADLSDAYEAATEEPPTEALVEAARGSVGAALTLAAQDGAGLQDLIAAVLAPLPQNIDRSALHVLADSAAGAGKEAAFRTAAKLITDVTARLATSASGVDAPPAGYERLTPAAARGTAPRWAETTAEIAALTERTLSLNLDRRQALLDMVARIERVAKGAVQNAGG